MRTLQEKKLFIGLRINKALSRHWKQVAQSALGDALTRSRWTSLNNSHLTLAFLGLVPVNQLTAIQSLLQEACLSISAWLLEASHIARFPDASGHIIAVMIKSNQQLQRLHDHFIKGLLAQGIAVDTRPYKPHITLCRLHAEDRALTQLIKPIPVETDLCADKMVLFESKPSPSTGLSHYVTVSEHSLQ